MYTAIATFINTLYAAVLNLSKIGSFTSDPLGSIMGTNTTSETREDNTNEKPTATNTTRNAPLPQESAPAQVPEISTSGVRRNRSLITIPEKINARFNDTGSPAWKNQPGGKHLGTDFGGMNGTPVYAPYDMNIIKLGVYTDEGRKGEYIIGTLGDGTQYYTGHLTGTRVRSGQFVKAGTQLAVIGYYNHTHIQLRVNNALYDFEQYAKAHP